QNRKAIGSRASTGAHVRRNRTPYLVHLPGQGLRTDRRHSFPGRIGGFAFPTLRIPVRSEDRPFEKIRGPGVPWPGHFPRGSDLRSLYRRPGMAGRLEALIRRTYLPPRRGPSRRPLFPSRGILAYRSGPGLFQGRRSGFLRIRFYLAARIGGHLVLARRFGQIHSLYYPPARHRRRYLPLRGVTALIPLGPQQTALRVIEQPFPVQKAALVAGLLPGLAVVPIVLPRSRALAPGEAAFGRDLPVRVPFAQVHGHALPVHHHRTQGTIGPIHPELPVGPAVAETLPVGQAAQAVVGEALAGPG